MLPGGTLLDIEPVVWKVESFDRRLVHRCKRWSVSQRIDDATNDKVDIAFYAGDNVMIYVADVSINVLILVANEIKQAAEKLQAVHRSST